MTVKLLISILLLVPTLTFAKKNYTISKNDFINQFSDTIDSRRIYCFNKVDEKVFVGVFENTELTLNLNNEKKRILILSTIKFQNDIIEATEITPIWHKKVYCEIPLNDVLELSIKRKFIIYETPYYNIDSCRKIRDFKNDSILKEFSKGNGIEILLISKKVHDKDTIYILKGACYHLNFKDNNRIEYGVVTKITEDSIYVSNNFHSKLKNHLLRRWT